MGCFPCASLSSSNNNKKPSDRRKTSSNSHRKSGSDHVSTSPSVPSRVSTPKFMKEEPKFTSHSARGERKEEPKFISHSARGERLSDLLGGLRPSTDMDVDRFKARKFALIELVAATENFKTGYLLGAGGFGKVYKGYLRHSSEVVAIKRLDRNGNQGIREFVVEVLTLSNAQHDNLVKLIGYCAEAGQRLLVYEYMPLGSLEDHLHGTLANRKCLDWYTRMKIAACAAKGLEYLHNQMKPPVIYRDLKSSNILLGDEYIPKLSDFGLAKVGPSGDQTHVSTRVMGTYGYCAPEYAMTGQLTFKSDIYSFGVVLLELITGRKAIDNRKTGPEQNLVEWARPLFKDRRKFHQMADPALESQYPSRGLYQALAIAAMCTQHQPDLRPQIADVVTALSFLSSQTYNLKPNSAESTGKVDGNVQNASSPNLEGEDDT